MVSVVDRGGHVAVPRAFELETPDDLRMFDLLPDVEAIEASDPPRRCGLGLDASTSALFGGGSSQPKDE